MGQFILFLFIAGILLIIIILLLNKILSLINSFKDEYTIKEKPGTICLITLFSFLIFSMLNGVRMAWIDREWNYFNFNNQEPASFMDWATSFGTD